MSIESSESTGVMYTTAGGYQSCGVREIGLSSSWPDAYVSYPVQAWRNSDLTFSDSSFLSIDCALVDMHKERQAKAIRINVPADIQRCEFLLIDNRLLLA